MKRSEKRKINRRNLIKNEITPIYSRKFARNFLKNMFNTNKIQVKWRSQRIKLIGNKAFLVEYNDTTRSHIILKEVFDAGIKK
jgi:3-isopropylmalate dehydratase small subunit